MASEYSDPIKRLASAIDHRRATLAAWSALYDALGRDDPHTVSAWFEHMHAQHSLVRSCLALARAELPIPQPMGDAAWAMRHDADRALRAARDATDRFDRSNTNPVPRAARPLQSPTPTAMGPVSGSVQRRRQTEWTAAYPDETDRVLDSDPFDRL